MKDVNDKKTVDGFADLLDALPAEEASVSPPGVPLSDLKQLIDHLRPKRGRPVTGKAKDAAQRKRESRARQAARVADIKAGKPVTSKIIDLETPFRSALAADLSPGQPASPLTLEIKK